MFKRSIPPLLAALCAMAVFSASALASGPPVITAEAAENVTETTATVQAKVNPEGFETYVYIEYNGAFTAPVLVGASETEQTVPFALKGLQPGMTYPFHVVAFNSQGLVAGTVRSFRTLSPPPPRGESPWWHLSSGARPTVLQPGVAKDDVQELTVSATEGDFLITNFPVRELEEGHRTEAELLFAVLPYNASKKQLQEGLDKVYLQRKVLVTREKSTEENSRTWEVTFPGQATEPINANGNSAYVRVFGGERLGCGEPAAVPCKEEASVTQVSEGRPDGQIVVTAANLGDADVNGEAPHQVKILDKLPPGLEAVSIEGVAEAQTAEAEHRPVECSLSSLTCTFGGTLNRVNEKGETEVLGPRTLPPYRRIEILIGVKAGASSGEANEASVSGGEAPSASVRRRVAVGAEPAGFGVEDYELSSEQEGGALDTQAGSHPFQQTTTITLNQSAEQTKEGLLPQPVVLTKDLNFKWPAGLIGNPTPFPRCTLAQFSLIHSEHSTPATECPPQTAVGVARILGNLPSPSGAKGGERFEEVVPLFNLEPSVGEPARFGFSVEETPVFIDTSVRSGGDYGITVNVDNIVQTLGFVSSQVTVWGVPGDPRHDNARGYGCLFRALGITTGVSPCNPSEQLHPPPFLSMPTSCPRNPSTGKPEPLYTSVEGDSWEEPKPAGQQLSFPGEPMQALDGCNTLPFSPEIKVTPDGQQASKPTGLDVDVHVPQEGQLNPEGDAQSNIKDITVKLPAGVAINPSNGDGLQACSEGLVGFTGFGEFPTEPGVSDPVFSSYLPGSIGALAVGDQELLEPGKNFCANASKVGEVTIKTPLLPPNQPVKGFVYLASQEANPFGSVLALYIVAEDPVSGSLVELPGEVQLCQGAGEVIAGMTCEVAGQLVSTFENTPQLAFEDAELHFFGGERAPLATASRCGTYTTEATFTPWSGSPPVRSQASFQITSGPNGSPCPGASLPFSPSLTGGALNLQAGEFSPFTLTMSRSDGEQNLQSVEAKLPPGLSGVLSNIELCREPQANEGTCGPNSLIGETTVSVGVGGDPFTVRGGKFYLTGPYNGTGSCTVGTLGCAPFGITFEVPAKAGPFDFAKTQRNHPACDCVLVRAKIEINPLTAAITITSNPPGTPDAIPTMLEGIPLEIQHVNAITTRSDFQFNPTNCSKMAVTGTIHSNEGGVDTINVPFQVTNCATLKFAPKFVVSTSGKTSKAKGASLSVHLTYPKAPFGSQANIARVKVDLPKLLPSRLTTLQKACTAKQFEANPAGCPSASIIGHAKAITPLIPVPLEGPAYFVSHGGEAFPSLIMVLQGYGVTVDLVGTTFISKAGITSSTFKTVPDAPVGSFELMLPEGKFSALAANGNLCKSQSKLKMPTEFVAQNGLKINESTKISVTGCPKHKAKHAKKAGKRKQGKHRKK